MCLYVIIFYCEDEKYVYVISSTLLVLNGMKLNMKYK